MACAIVVGLLIQKGQKKKFQGVDRIHSMVLEKQVGEQTADLDVLVINVIGSGRSGDREFARKKSIAKERQRNRGKCLDFRFGLSSTEKLEFGTEYDEGERKEKEAHARRRKSAQTAILCAILPVIASKEVNPFSCNPLT
jgi:hypothetical protein